MFPFVKIKKIFSDQQKEKIVAAIRKVEEQTSGEIRVYLEHKNPYMIVVDRAKEIFHKLNMQHTRHRNAVLLYIAISHRELGVYADHGLFESTGPEYWNTLVQQMVGHFKKGDIVDAIIKSVEEAGQILIKKFPKEPGQDNEALPDGIVFGG